MSDGTVGEQRRRLAALIVAALMLTACTPAPPPPPPPPPPAGAPITTSLPPRKFTVATTERVRVLDPVAVTADPSHWMSYNIFQRLMVVEPGDQLLKPDAAQDCLFKSTTLYECQLRAGLRFHTGSELTSSDVKFSILRALRLGDSATVSMLSSLERVETPAALTVRFHLKWPDTQFGFALAAPATSIVNEEIYNPDAVRAIDLQANGSGPYRVSTVDDDGITVTRHDDYHGDLPAEISPVRVAYFKDSAAVEDAMAARTVDYVWHGLGEAASTRLHRQAGDDGRTETGYGPIVLHGKRVRTIVWNPASPSRLDAVLRETVAGALRDSRTMDSLLPPDVGGHAASFPLGGSATLPPLTGERPRLTLSYADDRPDDTALARRLRDDIEGIGGISVQLIPHEPAADLRLVDSYPATNTPGAWLLPYTSAPLPGSVDKVAELTQRWRGTTDRTERATALAEIQKQAAADLVVLPVFQTDETAWMARGHHLIEPRFGPGFQLALYSVRKD